MTTFYITTPIYYANSLPHLGHLYTTIVADVIARYKRQRGFDTFFLTGTDEHGINIERAAERNKRSPKEQADYISGELVRMFGDFGLDPRHGGYDVFMRTTEPFHYEGAQSLWKTIAAGKTPKGNEAIYKGFYEGWFCAPCAEFKTEEGYFSLAGSDVPFCKIHESRLDKVSEESYFFRLSDYGDALLEIIRSRPDRIRPEARRNEVTSFISRGLQDLSISRQRQSVSWGVPVPGDDTHVMYVWLDALSNYITALGYGNTGRTGFEKYWPGMHLVGKDILRFHTIYWWSFLLTAGVELPELVYAHGMWLDADGRKMGKTIGNVVEVDVLHKYFQVDSVRYFLLREMVFGQDGKFGYENLINRTNADLASGLGNLTSRTISMISKYREGKIPEGKISEENYIHARRAGVDPDGMEIVSIIEHARDEFLRRFDNFEFSQGLETCWTVVAKIDKMISDAKPWELVKDEKQSETLNAVLYRSAETLRWLSVMIYPVMPDSAKEIFVQLGLGDEIAATDPASLRWAELTPGTSLGEANAVFPRIDKTKVMKDIMNETEKKDETTTVAATGSSAGASGRAAPGSAGSQDTGSRAAVEGSTSNDENFITIDDFLKVDLRVGEVKVAERVPNADKLLRMEVDIGEEKPRQLLAGLAEYYEPEKLIGRKVVVVANLKPRKMRGMESQGMICAASLAEGDSPAIATFLENVKVGARLK